MATIQALTPIASAAFSFGLLIDPPTRETRQTVAEQIIPGTNTAFVDIIGKSITKIRGTARIDTFALLKLMEGIVGSNCTLIYSEEPAGVPVLFVSLERTKVSGRVLGTGLDTHLCNVEFWLTPVA